MAEACRSGEQRTQHLPPKLREEWLPQTQSSTASEGLTHRRHYGLRASQHPLWGGYHCGHTSEMGLLRSEESSDVLKATVSGAGQIRSQHLLGLPHPLPSHFSQQLSLNKNNDNSTGHSSLFTCCLLSLALGLGSLLPPPRPGVCPSHCTHLPLA